MSDDKEELIDNDRGYPCQECGSGMMRMRTLTYFTWLNQELITVPNFPGWVCDVCGQTEYDSRAIVWLNTVLNPEAGRRLPNHRRQLPQQIDRPRP